MKRLPLIICILFASLVATSALNADDYIAVYTSWQKVFADEPDTCYLFEQAGSQVSLKNCGQWFATMPEDELQRALETDAKLRRDWDEHYGDRMQKLVFIGQHLDREAICALLDACLSE